MTDYETVIVFVDEGLLRYGSGDQSSELFAKSAFTCEICVPVLFGSCSYSCFVLSSALRRTFVSWVTGPFPQ